MTLRGVLDVDDDTTGVRFAYTAENTGDDPIELAFRSGQRVEVVVTADDETMWRYSDGRMFTQAIETTTVAPGESFTTAVTWDDPAPGEYIARITLATQEADATVTQPFTVTSRQT